MGLAVALALAGWMGAASSATHVWLVVGEPDARVADSRSAATTFRVADILHGLAATTSTTQLFLADPAS
ncbi:hypothetical protein, partial [Sphaerotilus sp.]|uniref:hypothetical protein n=1 Tax=Sphaerotilus sp. TaxID=2093942 RepID=UPI0034E1FEBC